MLLRPLCFIGLLLIPVGAQSVDLITVYEEALRTNPQLAAAAANLDAVRERRPQALAGLLPEVFVDGSLSRLRVKNLNQSQPANRSTNKTAGINLTQPLIRYDRWIQLKQSDSEIAGAEAAYVAAEQELMIQVAERYFQVLDAQDNLKFAESEKSSIGRQLDQATQRFEVGLIAITDVKAAQARFDLSVSQEIQAISGLVEAKDSLREIVGTYYDKLTPLTADLELVRPQPESTETWVEKAKQQNLSILTAEAAAELARQEINRQRAGHYPTLDLNAGSNYRDTGIGVIPVERYDNEIGVQLNIPVYQGGAVNSRTREARNRFQEATEQLQQEIRSAEFETRNAYRGVMTDIAQVRALGKSLESTEIAVEAEEAGFEVGTRTIVDVLNATRENYLARLNYARARYLYVVDQLRLKRAAGILSRQDMLEVNSSLDPANSAP
ncbi:MAG: TolC family outer membrane protein [Thiogranum sp.]